MRQACLDRVAWEVTWDLQACLCCHVVLGHDHLLESVQHLGPMLQVDDIVLHLVGQGVGCLHQGLQCYSAHPQDVPLPQARSIILQHVQLVHHHIGDKCLHVLEVCGECDCEHVEEEFVGDPCRWVAIIDGVPTVHNTRLCWMFDNINNEEPRLGLLWQEKGGGGVCIRMDRWDPDPPAHRSTPAPSLMP